jgi:CheY-like chemotaxis protein
LSKKVDECKPLLRGRHILYAEDSIPSQKIVQRMLERAGVRCTVVDNGEAAVHAALHASPPFDCILMDCNMPVLDGRGLTDNACHSSTLYTLVS